MVEPKSEIKNWVPVPELWFGGKRVNLLRGERGLLYVTV